MNNKNKDIDTRTAISNKKKKVKAHNQVHHTQFFLKTSVKVSETKNTVYVMFYILVPF